MADLQAPCGPLSFFLDQQPKAADFAADLHAGLSATPKGLPPKHFYDERGSDLFARICETPEYYVTRTELSLMRESVGEMARTIGADASIVEYGSGVSEKVALLLDALEAPADYVAIDISREFLLEAAERIARERPGLRVGAICADFFDDIHLPTDLMAGKRTVGYFPGSTIGNFEPGEAEAFLRRARETLGEGASFLLGADLVKDEATLVAAYDDAEGLTAAFNLNVLRRARAELDAEVDLDAFRHRAIWNAALRRIEMHLEVTRATEIVLRGRAYGFKTGETIHTENSHKHDEASLGELAEKSGWRLARLWRDPKSWFAVALLD